MTPRKTNNNVSSLPYWDGHPYNVTGTKLIGQCVWYVMGRVGEVLGYPMTYWESMPNCSSNPAWNYVGVKDAKHWLDNTRWQVSKTPVVGSVLVLDGYYGHVAFVEEDLGNGKYGISQYNKNSDRKFHYEEVDLSGSKVYGMTIKGYLVVPIEEVKRDESKHQFKVVVNNLRIRKDHNVNADVLRFANYGEIFNVLGEHNDGTYKWYQTDDGWLATTNDWIEDYPTTQDELVGNATLVAQIESLESANKELTSKIEKYEKLIKDISSQCEAIL